MTVGASQRHLSVFSSLFSFKVTYTEEIEDERLGDTSGRDFGALSL